MRTRQDAQGGQHFGAFAFGIDRPIRRLAQGAGRAVAVDADDQQVAQRPCVAKIANMAWVEDVEHTIGEDDDLSGVSRAVHQPDGFARGQRHALSYGRV